MVTSTACGSTLSTEQFFDLVLPAAGLRCIAVPCDNPLDGFRHSFKDTTDAAAAFAADADRRGVNVYFACASFLDKKGGRKGVNACAARSFWLDLDVGENKPYATQRLAAAALLAFVRALSLPTPLIVSSGKGLHVYWPMSEDMDPVTWKLTATYLKAACKAFGLKADPSRTSDIASVLRPVGTHHRKAAPTPVTLLRGAVPTTLEPFHQSLVSYLGTQTTLLPEPQGRAVAAFGGNGDLAGGITYAAAFSDRVADQCGVVGLVRDKKGCVDQPTWFHTGQVLAFCEDGEATFHEWSSGDPRYTHTETQAAFDRVKAFKPTSCEKLGDHQPDICGACPHFGKLKSPIGLGTRPAAIPTMVTSPPASPRPLPRKLEPVEPCRLEFLPLPFQAWAKDIAEGTPTPLDFVTAAVLTMAGSVVGSRVALDLKRAGVWSVTPNAWGMGVGDPSTKKTPASAPVRGMLAGLEKATRADFATKLATFQAEKLVYEQATLALKSVVAAATKKAPGQAMSLPPMPSAPVEPTPKRYLTSDSSHEALGVLCQHNPGGMLVFQDELSGLLGELAKPERQAAKGLMLSGWSGSESYTFDRIGRGTIELVRFSISVFGTIQPALLERLLVGGARSGQGADGLCQRFGFMVWPDPLKGRFVDQPHDKQAHADARAAFDTLAALDPMAIGAIPPLYDGPPTFDLDDDAYSLFQRWYEDWHLPIVEDPGELDAYRQHVAKLPKVIANEAVLIHVLESGGPSISGSTMARALGASRYFASHARRVYNATIRAGYEPARTLARRMSLGDLAGSFTERDAKRLGWSGMATPDDARRVLEILEDEGWIARTEKAVSSAGGRPSTTWTVADAAKGAAWE